MVLTEAQLQEIAKRVRAIIRAESKGVGFTKCFENW